MAETKEHTGLHTPFRVGIYHAPKVVGVMLRDRLTRSGYSVTTEVPCGVPLGQSNADLSADAWLTKWTFGLTDKTLGELRPRKALITMSVGKDHIDVEAAKKFGLDIINCPTYCSVSVAEHALALAFRAIYGPGTLPSLVTPTVIFDHFSNEFAEAAVAQILIRSRQMEDALARTRKYDYSRGDSPWKNQQLTGSIVGIIGHERDASRLARILHLGFQCNLIGFDFGENLDAFGVQQRPLEEVGGCEYVFNCARDINLEGIKVDARSLPEPDRRFTGSNIFVLGAGGIGSIIARVSKFGFDCDTASFSRAEKPHLSALSIKHVDVIDHALRDADFIFICLSLNNDTKNLLNGARLIGVKKRPVIVNVTRDEIIDSPALYSALQHGLVHAYATDVLPHDKILWAHGDPSEFTRNFMALPRVFATPHEADCSQRSLDRLVSEVEQRLAGITR